MTHNPLNLVDQLNQIRSAFIFDSILIVLWLILVILISVHDRDNPTEIKKRILATFLWFWGAMLFSWATKFIYLETGKTNINDFLSDNPWLWLIGRITQFRFGFSCMIFGLYHLFKLQINIFEKNPEKGKLRLHQILVIISVLYNLTTFFNRENFILDLIAFIITATYAIIVISPFILNAYRLAARLKQKERPYRRRIQSLVIMGVFLLLVMVFMMLDWIFTNIDEESVGYTIFYYLSWGSIMLGFISAYLGYILPPINEK